ncbi:coiled-coil domain-containing protein 189-like isoform X2 [Dendronephthya gigantea]|uniref:coiled-coil domain-containing protein 189-like isoform X2 n=1 Tax=Dendronephthya gigantea TaxID=151771 RepID=UPI00106C9E1C|nr:coiled-coil domain-containing protein 189-like isoform X2 [Dendronephthya gigantea]
MPSAVNDSKKPCVLLWHDLDVHHLHTLKESTDKLGTLAEIFCLKSYKDDLKSAILLDLYFYTLQFAEKKGFSDEQTSGFLSIIKSVHEKAVDTPYGNVDDTYQYFKELLLCHSVKRPPFSIQLFTADQVQMITDYTVNTYFKHFKLYKYAFTPKVRLDLTFEYMNMPETPVPKDEEEDKIEEKHEDVEDELNQTAENQSTEEDSPAVKELKNYISATLTEQVNQLRLNVDEQIKASNETLSQKLGFSFGGEKEVTKSPKMNKKKGK